MRSSGGTNFGLARSVVSRTKSRIACLADPSFHDGNGPLEAVSADAETDKGGADRAGSNANVVSRVRRSMPERRMFLLHSARPLCADIAGNVFLAWERKCIGEAPARAPFRCDGPPAAVPLAHASHGAKSHQLRVLRDARGPDGRRRHSGWARRRY